MFYCLASERFSVSSPKPLQLFVFTQFQTKNRYALFLELL